MPTSSPEVFTNAPPLLPGLTAASVWINDSIPSRLLGESIPRLRDFALTMPAVTVELSWNGLPTARTHSPTCNLSESPNFTMGSFSASIFSKAMSVDASLPMRVASNERLSLSVTSILSAWLITWLLVTMYPSSEMITPDPIPMRGCGA